MKTNDLTKDEKSLLLFFEAHLVDNFGKLPGINMNAEDFDIAEKFKKQGLIDFGRLKMAEMVKMEGRGNTLSYWVRFSNEAWILAHKLRRERTERHVETIGQGRSRVI